MTTRLSHGCSYSKIWVSPSNWRTVSTQKSLKKSWYVECKYYDPLFKEKYPKGFPFRKRVNRTETLQDRRAIIEVLLKEIPILFEAKEFNPITKKIMKKVELPKLGEFHPDLPIIEAFQKALGKTNTSKKYKKDMTTAFNRFNAVVKELRMEEVAISKFRRSELKTILEYMELPDNYFNKVKAYVSSLFVELIEYDCCEINLARDIRKKKIPITIRETLEPKELAKIVKSLKVNQPEFYRYLMIFYYSGARSTELLRVQKKDVNFEKQEYKVIIQKGKQYTETIKIILPNALPFWKEIMKLAKKEDYLFAKNLSPGIVAIDPIQISRRWRNVKKEFKITADFYSLKHLFLDELDKATQNSELNLSSKMASHTTPSITNSVYLVGKKKRDNEILKKLDIKM